MRMNKLRWTDEEDEYEQLKENMWLVTVIDNHGSLYDRIFYIFPLREFSLQHYFWYVKPSDLLTQAEMT